MFPGLEAKAWFVRDEVQLTLCPSQADSHKWALQHLNMTQRKKSSNEAFEMLTDNARAEDPQSRAVKGMCRHGTSRQSLPQ